MEVFLIAAMSADGFISPGGSRSKESSTAWTGEADRKRFVALTKRARAMVLGRKTFETFGSRPLKGRDLFVLSRSPPGVTKITGTAASAAGEIAQTAAAAAPEAPGSGGGAGTVEWTKLPPRELVAMLAGRGYAELALCGGSEIYAQFLEADLVDRMYLTIEPVLFGDGVRLSAWPLEKRLELVSCENAGNGSVFLEYRLQREGGPTT
jgi:dihydrofolate reductase